MSPFRYRDDDDSATGTMVGVLVGALAGFAVGMLVAQRVGGFGALTSRLSRLRHRGGDDDESYALGREHETVGDDELEDFESDEFDEGGDESLEEHVLEAFRNDPTLSERAVDIGGLGDGIVELSGWVETADEADHAVTLARGVPGVETVVNRLNVGEEEERVRDATRRAAAGDPAFAERHWESHVVGTGRRRQGTSDEFDRHADPRVELEERWTSEEAEIRNAAEDVDSIAAERRKRAGTGRAAKGDRTGGAPVAPTGVPKGDHVAAPVTDPQTSRTDAARDTGGERTDVGSTGRP